MTTENAWFAARPSGTEDVYKIYAESFRGPEHLAQVQEEAREVVRRARRGASGRLIAPAQRRPARLVGVHRVVGLADDAARRPRSGSSPPGGRADADADADRHRRAAQRHRLGDRVRRRSASTSASAGSAFSQTMLNSSPPRRAAVSLARSTGAQPVGERHQHRVAHRVAERVVDRLEAVEVDDQHAGRRALAVAALQRVPQPVLEQDAVGQAGQRVVQRPVDQLLPPAPSAR